MIIGITLVLAGLALTITGLNMAMAFITPTSRPNNRYFWSIFSLPFVGGLCFGFGTFMVLNNL